LQEKLADAARFLVESGQPLAPARPDFKGDLVVVPVPRGWTSPAWSDEARVAEQFERIDYLEKINLGGTHR